MKTYFDIEEIVVITNELDYERVLVSERKLRLLAKENPYCKILRTKLRDIIEEYENVEWNDVDQIDDNKLLESDKAEYIVELERLFCKDK
ncbi:hypothetical protein ACHRVK_09310 [Flavobacterium plurextorum]|uniref:hypothetical protein n=1 Tax=Flavobacterium plurextorum TaxID=1114867 RepID=UPI003756FCE8